MAAGNSSDPVSTANTVQLGAAKPQTQKYYTIDMSTYPHKLISVPRPPNSFVALHPGSVPQLLQNNNNGQQLVQIQLPTNPQVANTLNMQTQQTNRPQQQFVRLPANFLSNNSQMHTNNQQKVSIQLVQHPNQQQFPVNRFSQQPNTSLTNDNIQLRPILISPQKSPSLVGTVSVAQPTPLFQLTDLVQRGPQQVTPRKILPQQVTYIQASPVKTQATTNVSSSSLFQAFQLAAQGTSPLNTLMTARLPSTNVQTVLTTLRPQQQVNIQPRLQVAQNRSGTQPETLQGATSSKERQPAHGGFQGTIVMVSGSQVNAKQQTLAPKVVQTNTTPVFLPITMANNVSVLSNQQSTGNAASTSQLGPTTTLRIQQQIAPRAQLSTNQLATSTSTQRKFFIPVQPTADQQQYILQTIPQSVVKPQYSVKNQSQQRRDSSSTSTSPSSNKPSKTSSTSSTGSLTESKPAKKPCNCTKSQCLKLYCECFANGEFCNNCNCRACHNSIAHEAERSKAIKACLERNPYAFHPKIGKGKVKGDNERRHTKGCNCKRSGCLKNYCECYEAKILCSTLCKCSGCKNFEESSDRQTLMHLADAAEVRVQQQNAAKSKLAAQLSTTQRKITSREKLPYTFMTADVSRATCDLLLASVQESETLRLNDEKSELSVLEEFSHSLTQIIEKANHRMTGKR